MSTLIDEKDLPEDVPLEQAVEAAYPAELAEIVSKLRRGLPCLVECDKELAPFVFAHLRKRAKDSLKLIYIDGRKTEASAAGVPVGMMGSMISQLRDAVRGNADIADPKTGKSLQRVITLPHLDLLATSQGGLTSEAREAIVLLYENPEIVWLGFKDPTFPLPKVIENLFPHRISLVGIPRQRLRHLITRREARKFGKPLNVWSLYKYVSGLNPIRLRKVLNTLEGEDYPADTRPIYSQLRQATLTGSLEIPNLNIDTDIGGYAKVKKRLKQEILEVLARRDAATNEEDIQRMEDLIPRGMIFWGPPGTGKTFFAKTMAAALGAAVTIVSGPELKSKWVGESEEQLRQVFHRARQSAPSIIIFDELDSFASARGTYTGSGVEHSMVNQLLTEMDGFHKEELVFVVGTTNFVEVLDPALLRPGRFEFHLYIPYPEPEDRREIIAIYDRKMHLQMTGDAIDFAVKRTNDHVIGAASGTRYSGDHLFALCRSIARIRLRDNRKDATTAADVERALTEFLERPKMAPGEERVLATHEAGHAIVSLHCPNAPMIERITIASEMQWAFGYVKHADPAHKYVQTVGFYRDMICVALGAREAEKMLLNDLSLGATGDLASATGIARELVEVHGLGGDTLGLVQYFDLQNKRRREDLSTDTLRLIDERVREVVEEQRVRAHNILKENKAALEALRDMLLELKTIDAKSLVSMGVPKV